MPVSFPEAFDILPPDAMKSPRVPVQVGQNHKQVEANVQANGDDDQLASRALEHPIEVLVNAGCRQNQVKAE